MSRARSTLIACSTAFLLCLGADSQLRAQSITLPEVCMVLIHQLPVSATLNDVYSVFGDNASIASCITKIAFPHEQVKMGHSAEVAAAANAQTKGNAIQAGAPSGVDGTTSAISKPVSPLSLATEYGGITSSTSNQTVTFQIPLDGIPRALATSGRVQYCAIPSMDLTDGDCITPKLLDRLDKFSFTVSMNTSTPTNSVMAMATGASQANAQPVTATSQGGSRPSFSGATAKFVIIKPTASLPTVSNTLPSAIAAGAEAATVQAMDSALGKDTEYDVWRQCFAAAWFAAPAPNRDAVSKQFFAQLGPIIQSGQRVTGCPQPPPMPATRAIDQAALLAALRNIIVATGVTEAKFDSDVLQALGDPVLSFEYDYATPQNQESNSTFKLVGSKGWFAPKSKDKTRNMNSPRLTGTLNVAASIYNATPSSAVPSAGLLRSLQAGAELDYVVPTSKLPGFLTKIGDTTASLAYYYQDQASPSILKVTPGSPLTGITLVDLPSTATQIFTQKGPIQVGQFKYGFGTGKNVKFPIAVTYSSRSELIVHPSWGVQFGVSYDFTPLFSGNTTTQK
jgi:hypothetical protein